MYPHGWRSPPYTKGCTHVAIGIYWVWPVAMDGAYVPTTWVICFLVGEDLGGTVGTALMAGGVGLPMVLASPFSAARLIAL